MAISEDGLTLTTEWWLEDVLSLDDSLSEEQAKEVLRMVDENHDANFGVNWDVLQFWIDELKEGKS